MKSIDVCVSLWERLTRLEEERGEFLAILVFIVGITLLYLGPSILVTFFLGDPHLGWPEPWKFLFPMANAIVFGAALALSLWSNAFEWFRQPLPKVCDCSRSFMTSNHDGRVIVDDVQCKLPELLRVLEKASNANLSNLLVLKSDRVLDPILEKNFSEAYINQTLAVGRAPIFDADSGMQSKELAKEIGYCKRQFPGAESLIDKLFLRNRLKFAVLMWWVAQLFFVVTLSVGYLSFCGSSSLNNEDGDSPYPSEGGKPKCMLMWKDVSYIEGDDSVPFISYGCNDANGQACH